MKNQAFLFLAFTVFAFACKDKDDDTTSNPLPIAATDYFPLTQGSYWIYQWYKIDSQGNAEIWASYLDSIYVSGDSIINGITYAKVEGTYIKTPITYFYRDSSGFLVDENGGAPLFSTTLETEVLGVDTFSTEVAPLFWREYKMAANTSNVTVPAGTFDDCLQSILYLTSLEPDYEHGVRTYPLEYAKGVGLVRQRTSFYHSPDYLEGRLMRYNIE